MPLDGQDPHAVRLIRQQSDFHSREIYQLAKDQFLAREPRRGHAFEMSYWCGPKLYKDAPDAT